MSSGFYNEGELHRKIKKGVQTDMSFLIRVSRQPEALWSDPTACHNENSQLLFGPLVKVGSQLFASYIPEIGAGSYIQVRQDQKDGDQVDVEILLPHQKRPFKPPEIHHQGVNKQEFFYTSFVFEGWNVSLAIGSCISQSDLNNKFFDKLMKQ